VKTVYTIIKKASKIPADIVRYTFLARDAAYIFPVRAKAYKPVLTIARAKRIWIKSCPII
jgi:hypothetical protein